METSNRASAPARCLNGLSQIFLSAVLLCLSLGAALSIRKPAHALFDALRNANMPAVAIACLATVFAGLVLGGAVKAGRRPTPFKPAYFVPALTIVSLAVHLVLALIVDPAWSGDYQRYWDAGLRMAAAGSAHVDGSYYDQRALLIAYPVASVFGDLHAALKLTNALLLIAIGLLGYDLMRLCRSHQAAQAFSILFLFAPIPAYAALIPSHDLWGLFFTTCALWLVGRACFVLPSAAYYWGRVCAYGLLAAIGIEMIELQRGAGFFFAAAVAVTAALTVAGKRERFLHALPPFRNPVSALVVVAVFCTMLLYPIGRISTLSELRVTQSEHVQAATFMKLAAHGGTMSNGKSGWYARFDQRFEAKAAQGPEATLDFASSIALTSWVTPFSPKLQHMLFLTPRLFDMGYPSDWDTTLRAPRGLSKRARGGLVYYANVFGVLFTLLFLAALMHACFAKQRPPAVIVVPLVFTAGTALVLLALFENKAPNLFSVWLAAPMLVAWAATDTVRTAPWQGLAPSAGRIIGAFAMILGCLLILKYGLSGYLTDARGRILDDWTVAYRRAGTERFQTVSVASNKEPSTLAFGRKYYNKKTIKAWVLKHTPEDAPRVTRFAPGMYTTLELPTSPTLGDTISMSRKVCAGQTGRDDLEFFLFASYRRTGRPDSFFVDVIMDGKRLQRLSVPSPGPNMRLVEVEDVFNKAICRTLEIRLTANVTHEAASWQRASHVEIWFPRLTDAELAH